MAESTKDKGNEHRDPITHAPGAHPVGTGIGAAAGGVAGAAAAGAIAGSAAGPVGTGIGMAAGAVIGGLAGKAVAGHMGPKEDYWREHYRNETYFDPTYTYDDYLGAYRIGHAGYDRLGKSGKRFEEAEADLRKDYERDYGRSPLSWEKARAAVRAAWNYSDRNLEQYLGHDVLERQGEKIGTVDCIWADHMHEPAFLGVRTGWLFGKTHVVPAQSVSVSEAGRRIRLPYDLEKVKNAPAYDPKDEMTTEREREVYRYYGVQPEPRVATAGKDTREQREQREPAKAAPTVKRTEQREVRAPRDEANIQLVEEQMRVGKRDMEVGGIRLRKVVRTETVHQPVELRREEIVIERVPGGRGEVQGTFTEEEVYIPLRREEAVIGREAHVREEVRVHKTSHMDKQDVAGEVRREDLEIERSGEAKSRFDPDKPAEGAPAAGLRERETTPRSQRQQQG